MFIVRELLKFIIAMDPKGLSSYSQKSQQFCLPFSYVLIFKSWTFCSQTLCSLFYMYRETKISQICVTTF